MHTSPLSVDPHTVALAGDWHGDVRWVQKVLPAIRRASSDVTTVLHLGDFGLWPGSAFLKSVDYWAASAGLRLVVTPGNHDNWGRLTPGFAAGEPFQVSESVCFLPRGYRFNVGPWTVMSFGGAASPDMDWRQSRRTKSPIWWADEVATEAELEAAASGGAVDILLTHETATTVLPQVAASLARGISDIESRSDERVRQSRGQIDRLLEATRPRLHIHGHTHVFGVGRVQSSNTTTVSLANEFKHGNVVLLDTNSLDITVLDDVIDVERSGLR